MQVCKKWMGCEWQNPELVKRNGERDLDQMLFLWRRLRPEVPAKQIYVAGV